MVHFALFAQCSMGKISLFKIAKHYKMLTQIFGLKQW